MKSLIYGLLYYLLLFVTAIAAAIPPLVWLPLSIGNMRLALYLNEAIGVVPCWCFFQVTLVFAELVVFFILRTIEKKVAAVYGVSATVSTLVAIGWFWFVVTHTGPPN